MVEQARSDFDAELSQFGAHVGVCTVEYSLKPDKQGTFDVFAQVVEEHNGFWRLPDCMGNNFKGFSFRLPIAEFVRCKEAIERTDYGEKHD